MPSRGFYAFTARSRDLQGISEAYQKPSCIKGVLEASALETFSKHDVRWFDKYAPENLQPVRPLTSRKKTPKLKPTYVKRPEPIAVLEPKPKPEPSSERPPRVKAAKKPASKHPAQPDEAPVDTESGAQANDKAAPPPDKSAARLQPELYQFAKEAATVRKTLELQDNRALNRELRLFNFTGLEVIAIGELIRIEAGTQDSIANIIARLRGIYPQTQELGDDELRGTVLELINSGRNPLLKYLPTRFKLSVLLTEEERSKKARGLDIRIGNERLIIKREAVNWY